MNSFFKEQMEEAGGGSSRGRMIISVLFSVHGHAHKFSRSISGLFWVMSSTSGACCGPKIRTIHTIIWYFSFLGGLDSGNMIQHPLLGGVSRPRHDVWIRPPVRAVLSLHMAPQWLTIWIIHTQHLKILVMIMMKSCPPHLSKLKHATKQSADQYKGGAITRGHLPHFLQKKKKSDKGGGGES